MDNYLTKNARRVYVFSSKSPLNATADISNQELFFPLEPNTYTMFSIPPDDFSLSKLTTSSDKCGVIGFNEEPLSVDAFSVQPFHKRGGTFIAASVTTTNSYQGQLESIILVIAGQSSVAVTVRPTVDGTADVKGNVTSFQKDEILHFVLNLKEVLRIVSWDDLSGTRIESNKGVTVYSGHECGFPQGEGIECDHMVEQMPSVETWGTEYVTSPLLTRRASYSIKILSAHNDTLVSIKCIDLTTVEPMIEEEKLFKSGNSYTLLLNPTQFCHIQSTRPVLVVQYSTSRMKSEPIGGPFMAVVPDAQKLLGNISFLSIDTEIHRFHHFASFVFKNSSEPLHSFSLDGAPKDAVYDELDFGADIGTFVSVRMSVEYSGLHVINHDNFGQIFSFLAYGFGKEFSYGYSLGFEKGKSMYAPSMFLFLIKLIYPKYYTPCDCILFFLLIGLQCI